MAADDAGPRLVVEAGEASEARAAILAGLRAFNRRHTEPPDFRPLVLTARAADDAIVGGLAGETGWHWLFVDLLWVDDAHRGRGLGSGLLRRAEQEARARGARHVYLDTFGFQARPFYERHGYTLFGVLDDYPPGSRRYFLRKDLDDRASGE
jgi:GNAT superfamily N-acetyltransferase